MKEAGWLLRAMKNENQFIASVENVIERLKEMS